MTVLGRGLIYQPVLASVPHIKTYTYNHTIMTHYRTFDIGNRLSIEVSQKVNNRSKYNGHGIKTEHTESNKYDKRTKARDLI